MSQYEGHEPQMKTIVEQTCEGWELTGTLLYGKIQKYEMKSLAALTAWK